MAKPEDYYDFIIIGGGTSGSTLARRLADTSSRPSILLLEAGGEVDKDPKFLSPALRFLAAFTQPELDWGDKTVPQSHVNKRELGAFHGKGLGGSSASNFGIWVVAPREDYEEWARLAGGDEYWMWEGHRGVKQRLRKIEKMHFDEETETEWLDREEIEKGGSMEGVVDLLYGTINPPDLPTRIMNAGNEIGLKHNGDVNSGDPAGWGIVPATFYQGRRVTAATAYLANPPSNLTILTESHVAKILFDSSGKKAIGVKTASGKVFHALRDVVLSAGAINTPKVLLLSGVGPAEELAAMEIPVVQDLPSVGKNLQDHPSTHISLSLEGDLKSIAEASTEAGENSDQIVSTFLGCFSSPEIYASAEFQNLPISTRNHIAHAPTSELILAFPFSEFVPRNGPHLSIAAVIACPQSRGSVKLRSASPLDAPLIDLQLLSHPYDQRAMIETIRTAVRFQNTASWREGSTGVAGAPKSDSDEDILAFAKEHTGSALHPIGTCKVGEVTTADFRVIGLENLRVVDLAVMPFHGYGHTQSAAYLVGDIAAEKMIEEYNLNA